LFIFDYQKLQKWMAGTLAEKKERKIVIVNIVAGLLELIIVITSILLY